MKREFLLLELLWFVAGPMLLLGGLLNFEGKRLGWRSDEYSDVFYTYPSTAVVAAVLGIGLIAVGIIRSRRVALQNKLATGA